MSASSILQSRIDSAALRNVIQPMGWRLSLLLFGIPGLVEVMRAYWLTPALASSGLPPLYAEMIPASIVLAAMLLAAIIGYRLEGRALIWSGLTERFRLRRLTSREWLGLVGGAFALLLLQSLGGQLAQWLVENGMMPLPSSIPAWADPRISMPFTERFDAGPGGLRGNWPALFLAATLFLFNLFGEELWWRGYILPRQELVFGKWTWLVHGTMWAVLFHLWQYWRVIGLLPADLLLVFIAWRTKNNTTLLIVHGVQLFSFPLIILLAILGASI